jgi:hypothetical protein
VRAGLELVAAVGALKTHPTLQTRIGIATGLVVVGDLIGSGSAQEQAVVGETPNLAARLQGVAEPSSVALLERVASEPHTRLRYFCSAAVSRDLPIPGSPDRSTTWPLPVFALVQRRISSCDRVQRAVGVLRSQHRVCPALLERCRRA